MLRIADEASVGNLHASQMKVGQAQADLILAAENQSVDHVLGRAAVGGLADPNNTDTWARLSHYDQRSSTATAAVAQNQNGQVLINAPTGQSAAVAVAGEPKLTVFGTDIQVRSDLSIFPPPAGGFDVPLANITLDRDTGTVTATNVTANTSATLPANTTIGPNVTGNEIAFLDGVTSAIQTQLDGKADVVARYFLELEVTANVGTVYQFGNNANPTLPLQLKDPTSANSNDLVTNYWRPSSNGLYHFNVRVMFKATINDRLLSSNFGIEKRTIGTSNWTNIAQLDWKNYVSGGNETVDTVSTMTPQMTHFINVESLSEEYRIRVTASAYNANVWVLVANSIVQILKIG